jgi:hypothetical protein
LADRRGVPEDGKSKDEDKPKSRFPSKREFARRETARIDRQERYDEAIEETERQVIRLRCYSGKIVNCTQQYVR